MNRLAIKTLELLFAASMIEKDALTEKLTSLIEKYRQDPAKSEELAKLVLETIENFNKEAPLNSASAEPATKSDIALLMMEVVKLRHEIDALKGGMKHV
jgi:cobalamin biosynthesis Mg chelatase CobN